MKKFILIFSILLSAITISKAQSTAIAWQYTTAATQYSDAVICKSHTSGVFVAAEVNFNIICYMVSPSGSLIWTDTYDHGQAERIVDVEVETSTGNIYVLVNSEPLNATNLGMDYIILKYSPTGTLLQTLVHDHVDSSYSNENDDAYDMVLDGNGYIYVLARHFHGACTTADTKIVLDMYNSSLALQWNYSSPSSYVQPLSICFNSNGKLFASYKFNFIPKVGLFSATTGSLINEASLPVPGLDGSESLKLIPDNFGNIYGVADYYKDMGIDPGVFIPKLIKVDNTCQVLWTDTLGDATDPSYSHPNDLTVDANGDLYVSYTTEAGMGYKYARLAKTNGNGSRAWTKTIGLVGFANVVHDIDITPNNEVLFASSYDNLSGPISTFLRKFDSQGNVTWTSQSYSCQTITQPTGRIAVAQNGDVYVSGDAGTAVFTIAFAGAATGLISSEFTAINSLYPNPCESVLHLSFISQIHEGSVAVIRNTLGETVYTKTLNNMQDQEINVAELPAGYYLLSIEHGGGILSKQPFIRN